MADAGTGEKQPSRRVVIVGGVAGGASAAARLRRLDEDASITIFERGPDVSFANCGLPYHIGGEIVDRSRLLVTTPARLAARFGIEVHVRTEVLSINSEARTVRVRALEDGTERDVPYDALILSPGASAIRPPPFNAAEPHPRICTLRNLGDMDAIIEALPNGGDSDAGTRPRRAVVIGGGYIGLEVAEALIHRGGGVSSQQRGSVDVTIVELAPQVMGVGDPEMTTPLLDELTARGVDVRLGTKVTGLRTKDACATAACVSLDLSDGTTVDADLVVVAVGVRPEATLARDAGLAIGPRTGGIVVDARMRTSDPNIFAVGDAVQVTDLVTQSPACIPLAGPANRQGRVAADNIVGRGDATYTATQGTAIVRVFAQAFALTGLTEKGAKRAGMKYAVAHTHAVSHASYFPGSATLHLKLVYCPYTGRVLGAQAVGADGVDKRIDVLSTAIRARMTVADLADLELCYAPPFGSAKDPVNFLGMVALNNLTGDVVTSYVCDADAAGQAPAEDPAEKKGTSRRRRRVKLLDVRTPAEGERAGVVPDNSEGGYLCVPVDDLREALDSGRIRARGGLGVCGDDSEDAIDEFLVYCGVGIRAYIACRMLAARGIRATNLSGGYTTYAMSKRAEAAGKAGAAAVQAAEAAAAAKEGKDAGAHPAAAGVVSKSAEFELFYPHQRPTGSARVAQLR